MNLGESDGEASVISKDSQPKDDEDDYYEEMQMRAKMKPKKAALKQRLQHKAGIIEDNIETEGKNSAMDISQTMSPLMRRTKTNLSRDPGTKRRDSISPSPKSPMPAQSPKSSSFKKDTAQTPNNNIDRIESNISHL